MGRSRGQGTVRNSRFCACLKSKVWRERCSSPARSASSANISCPSNIPLRSRARRSCFREPRFWSLAGHPSLNRNRAQSHRSHAQRWTALTPAKGGRVSCETATSRRAQAALSHRNSVRTLRYSCTRRGKKAPSLPIRLQGTVVLPTINHQECSLMALQPWRCSRNAWRTVA